MNPRHERGSKGSPTKGVKHRVHSIKWWSGRKREVNDYLRDAASLIIQATDLRPAGTTCLGRAGPTYPLPVPPAFSQSRLCVLFSGESTFPGPTLAVFEVANVIADSLSAVFPLDYTPFNRGQQASLLFVEPTRGHVARVPLTSSGRPRLLFYPLSS